MSLIVEDGTGLADAQSYVSAVDADAYFLARANSVWAAATPEAKEAALVRATQALDGDHFVRGGYWPGWRATEAQALDWPRTHAWDVDRYPLVDCVPRGVKNATCEAALVELSSAGILLESLERGGALVSKKIGTIEKTWSAKAPVRTIYPTIRQALARVCLPCGQVQSARVIRA